MIPKDLVLPAVPDPSGSSKSAPKKRFCHDHEGSL